MIFSRETLDSNSKLNSLVQAESTQLLQQDSDIQAGSLEVSKHFQGFHSRLSPLFYKYLVMSQGFVWISEKCYRTKKSNMFKVFSSNVLELKNPVSQLLFWNCQYLHYSYKEKCAKISLIICLLPHSIFHLLQNEPDSHLSTLPQCRTHRYPKNVTRCSSVHFQT